MKSILLFYALTGCITPGDLHQLRCDHQAIVDQIADISNRQRGMSKADILYIRELRKDKRKLSCISGHGLCCKK